MFSQKLGLMSLPNNPALCGALQTLRVLASVSLLRINALALSKRSRIHFLRVPRAGSNKVPDDVHTQGDVKPPLPASCTTSLRRVVRSPAFCYQPGRTRSPPHSTRKRSAAVSGTVSLQRPERMLFVDAVTVNLSQLFTCLSNSHPYTVTSGCKFHPHTL